MVSAVSYPLTIEHNETHGLGYERVDDDPNVAVLVDTMDATARWPATLRLRTWERERLRLVEGERLLDVGCGLGEAALALAHDLGGTGEVVGVDTSAEMLRVARANAGAAKCKVHFRVGDACALDEPSGSFDAVRSERTLQWIADPLAAVEEMVALKDLLAGLGSNRIEARQDGAAFGTAARSDYLFNSGLTGIEAADVVVLIGCDPRRDAALLNVRLRKGAKRRRTQVFSIGPAVDLSYPVTWLGDDAGLIGAVPAELAAALAAAERPAVIVGMAALTVPGLFGAAQGFAAAHGIVRNGWNGWNLLHTAASRVGALDLGLTVAGGVAALDDAKLLFLLGADEVDAGKDAFTIYIGSHGDKGVRHADVILPAAAYTEKSGTWVNMEGRMQRSLRAVFPPGESREDWTVLRALSGVLGRPLPYDDLPGLRARIGAEWPHLGGFGAVAVTPGRALPELLAPAGALPVASGSHYLTNPIARASATMAECVAAIETPMAEAAE